jgi:hypothetical protein
MKHTLEQIGHDARSKRIQRPRRSYSYYLSWTVLGLAIILDFALAYWLFRHK